MDKSSNRRGLRFPSKQRLSEIPNPRKDASAIALFVVAGLVLSSHQMYVSLLDKVMAFGIFLVFCSALYFGRFALNSRKLSAAKLVAQREVKRREKWRARVFAIRCDNESWREARKNATDALERARIPLANVRFYERRMHYDAIYGVGLLSVGTFVQLMAPVVKF